MLLPLMFHPTTSRGTCGSFVNRYADIWTVSCAARDADRQPGRTRAAQARKNGRVCRAKSGVEAAQEGQFRFSGRWKRRIEDERERGGTGEA